MLFSARFKVSKTVRHSDKPSRMVKLDCYKAEDALCNHDYITDDPLIIPISMTWKRDQPYICVF